MIVNLNLNLVPAETARIDPADRGLLLGDGLFETMRAADGAPLRLTRHLARLRQGAAVLRLPLPWSDEALAAALRDTLAANDLAAGVLRLTLTRGPAPRGLLPPTEPAPTLLMAASPLPPAMPSAHAVIARSTRRNEHSPLARCKTLNYLDNVLARIEAEERGAGEALLLNTAGRLAETTIANLFAVIDGTLLTPPVEDGALPGVMRATVLQEAQAVERPILSADLVRASEAFLTSSLGIRPLLSVDGAPVGRGETGPVTVLLRERFG